MANTTNDAGSTSLEDETLFSRRHDLDALRATAMLLGILLHGALAYVTFEFWPIRDDRQNGAFDLFLSVVHGFRMPLFFMLSGFFAAMLWRKRGLPYLMKHRAKRVLLPTLLFLATIIPVMRFTVGWVQTFGGAESTGVVLEEGSLWHAAKTNNLEVLEAQLLAVEDINTQDSNGIPALNWAALNGSTEAAERLLVAGADVNVLHKDGSSPLSNAALMGRTNTVALFLEQGAELNSVNNWQSTALDNAHVDWGTVELVANMHGLEVDKVGFDAQRTAIQELLVAYNGKRNAGLHLPEAEGDEVVASGITAAYQRFAQWPGFWQPDYLGHLWFLWFLLILAVPFFLYAMIADALKWRGPPKWLFLSPVVLLWLVPLTMVPQWFHGLASLGFGPDTSASFIPPPHIVLLYAVFFFFGALYFDSEDRSGKLGRRWILSLTLGLGFVFPFGFALTVAPDAAWIQSILPAGSVRLVGVCMQALYAWLMTFGLIGLFRHIHARENKVVRYISDASYWLYVTHLPVIFLAQGIVKQWNLPVFVKFSIVCIVTTALLLLAYELCVRYTWLGTLLNGKRTRPGKKVALAGNEST